MPFLKAIINLRFPFTVSAQNPYVFVIKRAWVTLANEVELLRNKQLLM